MTYEQYRSIFIIAAVICGVMLALSLFLLYFFKIWEIIRSLSGITAQKAIRTIRERNQSGYDAGLYTGQGSSQRSYSGRLSRKGYRPMLNPASARLPARQAGAQMPVQGAAGEPAAADPNATTLLGTNETTLLSSNETTVLGSGETTAQGANETTVLSSSSNETTVLSAGETTVLAQDESNVLAEQEQNSFKVESELSYTQAEKIVE